MLRSNLTNNIFLNFQEEGDLFSPGQKKYIPILNWKNLNILELITILPLFLHFQLCHLYHNKHQNKEDKNKEKMHNRSHLGHKSMNSL